MKRKFFYATTILSGLFLALVYSDSRPLFWPLIKNELPQKSDVIIVLGGGLKNNGDLNAQDKERVLKGVELWREGYADRILISGGEYKNTGFYESEEMVKFVGVLGVPSEKLTAERDSKNTYGNALYSGEILKTNSWKTVILVTSAFHSRRACNVFKKQTISVTCVGADPSLVQRNFLEKLNLFRLIVREYAATTYYWFKEYI